jgi:hypothetical protein
METLSREFNFRRGSITHQVGKERECRKIMAKNLILQYIRESKKRKPEE